MDKRLELQCLLEEILGCRRVYYVAPSTSLEYPSIIYTINGIQTNQADNYNYKRDTSYKITVISKIPDTNMIQKILDLPQSKLDQQYISDNLYHDVFTLYY